jgi:hypothetical protein
MIIVTDYIVNCFIYFKLNEPVYTSTHIYEKPSHNLYVLTALAGRGKP